MFFQSWAECGPSGVKLLHIAPRCNLAGIIFSPMCVLYVLDLASRLVCDELQDFIRSVRNLADCGSTVQSDAAESSFRKAHRMDDAKHLKQAYCLDVRW